MMIGNERDEAVYLYSDLIIIQQPHRYESKVSCELLVPRQSNKLA
jgi:hypothetical protein